MLGNISESKNCHNCSSKFVITDNDIDFYDKISPTFDGNKFKIPSPTFCPRCRQQRRLGYRMERKLYKRKCDATGKSIISMYSTEKKDIVYDYDYWWGDEWDAMKYGIDFDFNKSFFEQINELSLSVPKAHVELSHCENSLYTNQGGYNKNCYLIFEAGYNENCMHCKSVWNSTNTIDCSFSNNVENCYECTDVKNSYKLFYSQDCEKCNDSIYLYDCQNCNNCIGCWNLQGKQYYIFNQKSTKEEFEKIYNNILSDNNYKQQFLQELKQKQAKSLIHKALDNLSSENVHGNNIINSKNCLGFSITGSENCYYCYDIYDSQNCMDMCYWGNNADHIYEGISIGNNTSKILFSYMCYGESNNLIYCMNCVNSCSNLFGCVGLKGKEYCVFNKQYTKNEYEKLVTQIIKHMQSTGEWGEFFPISISPFGYNETLAQEYFPISKENAISKGYKWLDKEYAINVPSGIETILAEDLPTINELQASSYKSQAILDKAIICEQTNKPFRIIKPELDFYIKYGIKIPTLHPDVRHEARMNIRNPREIFVKKCDKCGKDIKTTYSPEKGETVYCEQCYLKEIY